MKMTVAALVLLLAACTASVLGSAKVVSACLAAESFAESVTEATELSAVKDACEKWEKDRCLLGLLAPSQSLNAVTAQYYLLCSSLKAGDAEGVSEAKTLLISYASTIRKAERISFFNIF